MGARRELLASHPGAGRVDLDGCALLPTLVNAHAHLELTAFDRIAPGPDFVGWLLEVIERKRAAAAEQYRRGVSAGALECLRRGQGVVADVLSAVGAADAYPRNGPRCLVFPEVIAAQEHSVAAALARALSAVPACREAFGGIAPHAPYTACAAAYVETWRSATQRGGRLMTHLAESAEEVRFCAAGDGPIADRLYGALPIPPPPAPGSHPLEWLDGLGVLGPDTIAVHAVHLSERHVALLAARGAGVVLCPRSNRNLGVGVAPGRELLDAGVRVGLGTDSVLSSGGLDLWDDAVAAVEDYGWSPAEAVGAATCGGASVLGSAGGDGVLARGRRADILAARLGEGRGVWDRLLAAPRAEVLWLSGEIVYDRVARFARTDEPPPRGGPSRP